MGKVLTLRDSRPSGWSQDRWRWLNEVRQDGELSPMARLVGCSLGFGFANNKTGECRPGVQALARDVKVSPRTIERCLTDLQSRGWVVRLGGNAPGIRATFAFRFPVRHTPNLSERHTPELSDEHAPDLSLTHDNPAAPPRPPYMEEPNLNHKEPLHPRVAIRGLPMPDCRTKLIAPGSVEAQRWDEWLAAKGYPTLARIGRRDLDTGHYQMPVSAAPAEGDQTAYRIALRWAEWLRSRA